jgi:hypothetical protein
MMIMHPARVCAEDVNTSIRSGSLDTEVVKLSAVIDLLKPNCTNK